jgi:hypothetical protein
MLSSDLVAHHLIARSCPYLKRLLLLLFFFFFVSSKSGGREDEKPKKGNTSEERMRENAIIKTEVAVNKVGIIKTPNHPM